MSANSILSLKFVCEDYNIADEVVKIIMDYVKSHTFKHKINIQFLNGFNTMMDDAVYNVDDRSLYEDCMPQCLYQIMEEWGADGFTDMGCMESIVDWDWVIRQVREPVFKIPVGNDGRHLVSTITDFMETGGENCDS